MSVILDMCKLERSSRLAVCVIAMSEVFSVHEFGSEVCLTPMVCEVRITSGPVMLSMCEQEVLLISVEWVSIFAFFGAETRPHSLDNSAVSCCTGDVSESVLPLS